MLEVVVLFFVNVLANVAGEVIADIIREKRTNTRNKNYSKARSHRVLLLSLAKRE